MKRISAAGGTPESLANAPTARGGTWAGDTIVYAPTPAGGLFRIPAGGGEPRPVTELNVDRGDTSHRLPVFLPDGRHFLAFVQGAGGTTGNVLLGEIDSKENRMLMSADAGVIFAPPDYVLFVRDRSLRA